MTALDAEHVELAFDVAEDEISAGHGARLARFRCGLPSGFLDLFKDWPAFAPYLHVGGRYYARLQDGPRATGRGFGPVGDELDDVLARLVDAHGLHKVCTALMVICYGKAEHPATNWQDRITARQ